MKNGSVPTPYVPYNSIKFKVENNNFLNRLTCSENKLLAWATGLEANETGSLSSDFIRVNPNESLSFSYSAQILFYDKNYNYLGALDYDGITIKKSPAGALNKITVPNIDDIYYMRLGFRTTYNTGVNLLTADIMVNEGTTLSSYTPHAEQTSLFTFEKGQYIAEGGYLADDGIHNVIGKVILDGVTTGKKVTDVALYSSNGLYYCVCGDKPLINRKYDYSPLDMLCSHFKPSGSVKINNCYPTGPNTRNLVFVLIDQTITTVEQANAWLQEQYANGTPVTVEYELADPQPTPYTPTQQAQYYKMQRTFAYEDITHTSTDGDLRPSTEVKYYKKI